MLLKSYIIDRYLESPKPQKPWKKQKKSWGCLENQKAKKTKLWGACLVLTQKIVFLFSLVFFVSKAKNQKTPWVFVFFAYILSTSINQDLKNKKNSRFVLVFETFQCRKPNLKRWKTKNTPWLFFCFFEILVDHIHSKKKQKHKFFCFSISKPTKT